MQPQPEDLKSGKLNNTDNGDYKDQIAILNRRISQLHRKLDETKARKKLYSKPETKLAKSKTAARAAKKDSKELTAKEERFKAFKDQIDKKEQLEHRRYSKVGFYLQLFAEWTLTPEQQKRYHEELRKVNEKRRADGKLPK